MTVREMLEWAKEQVIWFGLFGPPWNRFASSRYTSKLERKQVQFFYTVFEMKGRDVENMVIAFFLTVFFTCSPSRTGSCLFTQNKIWWHSSKRENNLMSGTYIKSTESFFFILNLFNENTVLKYCTLHHACFDWVTHSDKV